MLISCRPISSPDSHVQCLVGIYRYSMGRRNRRKEWNNLLRTCKAPTPQTYLSSTPPPHNSTSSYINFMSWVAPPATNHLNQKLKKSHPRMLALSWPHIQLVRRHFRFSLKKFLNMILFQHLHFHCHCFKPLSFLTWVYVAISALRPSSHLGFSR